MLYGVHFRKGNIMDNISASSYLELLKPWLAKLPSFLRKSAFNPALTCYGTGESAHWPTQSNCNVFAALAVLGTAPDLDDGALPMKRDEILATSIELLRYAMATHLTGHDLASDGRQWGHHWISVLGLERMAHGVNAIRDFLTEQDRDNLKRMMISESDWLLEFYPVEAGLIGSSGKNKPESNIWNGGMLLRTALDYPDAPNRDRYLEKATAFFLNGLSHPLDAACETKFRDKPVREWHAGFNFTPNWSLDHHAYLNVGYIVVSLSNLAMIHFYCKERSYEAPPELYWHLEEVWQITKRFTFPDGRLLRIGGDTRARYTYCQNYAIPVWLMAADLFGDRDAAQFERGFLAQMKCEQEYSGDGGFYTKRLDNIRRINYYYYARLESDAPLCLSYGAYWRRKFQLAQCPEQPAANSPCAWQDEYHGATLNRSRGAIRSWVWHGAQGPTGLCVPASRSDMAEWQGNLHGSLLSTQTPEATQGDSVHCEFDGGFLNYGECFWRETAPLGEGEQVYDYARHRIVCAALPDAKTMLVLERAVIQKEITLDSVRGIGVKIPNDLFNGSSRRYRTTGFDAVLPGNPGKEDSRAIPSNHLLVDDALAVTALYGTDKLTVYRPAIPPIVIRKAHGPWLHSLYADEICGRCSTENQRLMPGAVAFDDGFAVTAAKLAEPAKFRAETAGALRRVEYESDDAAYLLIANFGAETATTALPAGAKLLAGSPELEPGAALLCTF